MSDEQEFILPAVKVIDGAFDGCKDFIDEIVQTDGWDDGKVGSGENALVLKEIRNVRLLMMDRKLTSPVSWYLVSRGMMMHALDYAKEYGYGVSAMEPPQVLHYTAGAADQQFYGPHVDTDHKGTHTRDFSAVLYLNTVEEGGETVFSYFGVGVQPVEGRIVFFPANYAYMHEALPPVSEDKFAIVTWFKFGQLEHDHSEPHDHDHGTTDMEYLKF